MTLPVASLKPPVSWLDDQLEYYDAEAESISNIIDEALKQEALRRKEMRNREIKVLLLGQSESGKSTLRKQFQLFYASQTLETERPSWRGVVYLNIIRALRSILERMRSEIAKSTEGSPGADPAISSEHNDEIIHLQNKLQPLIAAETSITSELNGGFSGRASSYVRTGWQTLVKPLRSSSDTSTDGYTPGIKLVCNILQQAQDDIDALWRHPLVSKFANLRKLGLEDSAPFFLDNMHRISESDYLPTMEDILNVRMQTLGVVEHCISVHQGGTDIIWRMYDVGGARGQRHAWIPYFDDATAIIFLAPISAFDQQLDEDRRINRLEDSLQLFTIICSNQLLKNASLILLLNKVDLLKKKLQSGKRVQKYIPSYGNRRNVYDDVSEYFRAHFKQVHHRHDTARRALFIHFTSMLDTEAMHIVIENVGDAILRKHISEVGLA